MRSLISGLLLLVVLSGCASGPKALTKSELTDFLGPAPQKAIHWTKFIGPDFDVFYGKALPPLSGTVGFYLGGYADFKPEPGSARTKATLGIYPVVWYTMKSPGKITQSALIQMDHYWQSHIWIEAEQQADIDAIVHVLSKLPTFTEKPKPL